MATLRTDTSHCIPYPQRSDLSQRSPALSHLDFFGRRLSLGANSVCQSHYGSYISVSGK